MPNPERRAAPDFDHIDEDHDPETIAAQVEDAYRQRFLADIIIGAVEGGTGYWAQVSVYKHDCPPAETTATLHEIEPASGDEPGKQVSIETITTGIQAIRCPGFSIRADLLKTIKEADRADDAGLLDAEAADVIVQAGLFGEIVYG